MSEKLPYTLSENSIVVFYDGKPHSVRKDNANFELLKQALFEGRYEDVPQYLDIVKAVEDFVEGSVEVKDEVVYYNGYRLHGVVVDKLLEMLRGGMRDSSPLTNYISRLMDNPSSNSVEQLYTFLGYRSLPITPEGKVLGYKGVQSDFWSSTGNADTIVVQGETNERHQILNEVGATIEVQRRCVDDNKDNHCSFGLHVGSYDYASGWAGTDGKLLLVEFDPQDAVSVPDDCSFQKLRVSKYKVVADISDSRVELDKAVYEANKPIYGSNNDCCDDEDCDYDCDDLDEEDLDDVLSDGTDQDYDVTDLAIRNYVENKHEQGVNPTIKNIADTKACRDEGVRCKDIVCIVTDLGFRVERDNEKVLSDLNVFKSDFWNASHVGEVNEEGEILS
jgi:hypothetical protein